MMMIKDDGCYLLIDDWIMGVMIIYIGLLYILYIMWKIMVMVLQIYLSQQYSLFKRKSYQKKKKSHEVEFNYLFYYHYYY